MSQKIFRPLWIYSLLTITASCDKGLSMKKNSSGSFFSSEDSLWKTPSALEALQEQTNMQESRGSEDQIKYFQIKRACITIQRAIKRKIQQIENKRLQQEAKERKCRREEEKKKRREQEEEKKKKKEEQNHQDFLKSYGYFLDSFPPHLHHVKYFFNRSYNERVFDLGEHNHDQKMIFSDEDNLILFDNDYFDPNINLSKQLNSKSPFCKPYTWYPRIFMFFNTEKIAYDINNTTVINNTTALKEIFFQHKEQLSFQEMRSFRHRDESKIYNFLDQHESLIIEEDFFNEISKHSIDTHRGILQKILLKLMWALWDNEDILNDFLSIVDFHDDNIIFGEIHYKNIFLNLRPCVENLFLNYFVTDIKYPFKFCKCIFCLGKPKAYRVGGGFYFFKDLPQKEHLSLVMTKILYISKFLKKNITEKEYHFLSLHIFDHYILETIFDNFTPHNVLNTQKKQYFYNNPRIKKKAIRINLFRGKYYILEGRDDVWGRITRIQDKIKPLVNDPFFIFAPQFFSKKYVMKKHTLQREENELFFEDIKGSYYKNVEVVRKDEQEKTYQKAKKKFIKDFNKKFIEPLSEKHFTLFYSDFSVVDNVDKNKFKSDFIKKHAHIDNNKYFSVDIFSSILSVLWGHDYHDHFIMKYYFMLNARCPFVPSKVQSEIKFTLDKVNREIFFTNNDPRPLFIQEEMRRLFIKNSISKLKPNQQEEEIKKIFSNLNNFYEAIKEYNLPIFFHSVQDYLQHIINKNNSDIEIFVNELLKKIEDNLPPQIQNLSYLIFLMNAHVAQSEEDFKKDEENFSQRTKKEEQPCFKNVIVSSIFNALSPLKFHIFEFLGTDMKNIYKIINYYQFLEGEDRKAVEKALTTYDFGFKYSIDHGQEIEIMIYNIVNALAAPYNYGHEKIDYYIRFALTPLVPYIMRVIKIIYGLPKNKIYKKLTEKEQKFYKKYSRACK